MILTTKDQMASILRECQKIERKVLLSDAQVVFNLDIYRYSYSEVYGVESRVSIDVSVSPFGAGRQFNFYQFNAMDFNMSELDRLENLIRDSLHIKI